MRTLTITLAFLILMSPYATARSNSGGLAQRVAELEAQVEELSAILEFVHVETEAINGLAGPHWIIEGANVHVQSGLGSTYHELCPPDHPRSCLVRNGLGNLIVGYNEVPPSPSRPHIRAGMHNLVVGPEHVYNGNGGFIAGRNNEASALGASVSGGFRNVASGESSSVSGGFDREAPDDLNWAAGSLFEEN